MYGRLLLIQVEGLTKKLRISGAAEAAWFQFVYVIFEGMFDKNMKKNRKEFFLLS